MNRQVLLPPYLEDQETWKGLLDSIDKVFKPEIDDATEYLSRLRDTWIISDEMEEKIQQGKLIDNTEWSRYEKEILIRQANQLGFDFKESNILSNDDYERITRNLGTYWYGKGTPSFINFLGFVLNSVITVKNLWSNNGVSPKSYGNFLPEGDSGIGTPVWQGGEWFPTTHVEVGFNPFKFANTSVSKLVALFYALANYNLVIGNILLEGELFITSTGETELAKIVVAYPMFDVEIRLDTAL